MSSQYQFHQLFTGGGPLWFVAHFVRVALAMTSVAGTDIDDGVTRIYLSDADAAAASDQANRPQKEQERERETKEEKTKAKMQT